MLEGLEGPGKFEKGVWHVSHIANVDHLDLCGLPPYLSKLRVMMGIEYRPLFWANMFNRLKSLEIGDQNN